MKRFFTTGYLLVYALGAIVLAATASFLLGGDEGPAVQTATAERGEVVEEVSVTGHIEAMEKRTLGFVESGVVDAIYVAEGESIERGTVLAMLESGALGAEATAARAKITSELRRLDEIAAATRAEEIDVAHASLTAATSSLERSSENLRSAISRAAQLSDNTIRTNIDQLYDEGAGESPRFGVTVQSGTTKYIISAPADKRSLLSRDRKTVSEYLTKLREQALYIAEDSAPTAAANALDYLIFMESWAGRVGEAVGELVADNTAQKVVYDDFKSDVASARATLSELRGEVEAARDAYESAFNSATVSERELTKSASKARPETMAVQEAVVEAARASYQAAAARLSNRSIVAPISGIVSEVSIETGEAASAGTSLITVVSPGAFEVVAYITEADIAKVTINDRATISFDAYDDLVVPATLISIAETETVIDGVPTYKATFALDDAAVSVKAGMTADIEIITDERNNVVYVPQRAVIREDGSTYIRVVEDNKIVKRTVVVGLKGSDGRAEIMSGVEEGEEVVLFMEEPKE